MTTRYTLISVAGQRLPHAVVRVTGEVEEAFTHNLRWEPSDLLSRVPNESDWSTRELTGPEDHLVSIVRTIRGRRHHSSVYPQYYAVFKDAADVVDLDKAYLLLRERGRYHEQKYTGIQTWSGSDKLYRLTSGRDCLEEYVSVSAAEAEQVQRRLDQRYQEGT
ncbi:hypothetical protein [Crossiella cryophila]|uniref:Uncharacterized protein n=1 Tax=Crossiella cryophila TaxID=43355 RepID=A0A7W7CC98_9PSEU|nr:hypothetical protein [Crossiella cryophila]MBB4678507.1 hypothetical protein [Crossiella cryophila]